MLCFPSEDLRGTWPIVFSEIMHMNNIKIERNSFLEYYQVTYIVMTFNIQAIEVYCLFIKIFFYTNHLLKV